MTMIDTLYDRHYKSREKLAWEFATIFNQEAKELEAAGVDTSSSTSPRSTSSSTTCRTGGWRHWSERQKDCAQKPSCTSVTATGSRRTTIGRRPSESEWRHYETSFPLLQQSSIDTISLESHHSHVPMELIELIRGKKVMLGAIDVASTTIETPEEVADTLRKALEFVDADLLIPSTELRHGAVVSGCCARETERPERRSGHRSRGARCREALITPVRAQLAKLQRAYRLSVTPPENACTSRSFRASAAQSSGKRRRPVPSTIGKVKSLNSFTRRARSRSCASVMLPVSTMSDPS